MATKKRAPLRKTKKTSKKEKKVFSLLETLTKKISTMLGILILVSVITTGTLFWLASISRQLSIITHSLTEITINLRQRQSTLQRGLYEQRKEVEKLKLEKKQNAKNKVLWLRYNNQKYNFSIQYPNNWTYVSQIFSPQGLVEFAPKENVNFKKTIKINLIQKNDIDAAIAASNILKNKEININSTKNIIINGMEGKIAAFDTDRGEIFVHYYFPLKEGVLEFSLNTNDKEYTAIFQKIVSSLQIK